MTLGSKAADFERCEPMSEYCRVVDNRVFLLGLDELYREAMKRHERDELLRCAREASRALSVSPADVPIEGYYGEDGQLMEYFQLMRAIQEVSADRQRELTDCHGFQRLQQVTRSGLFGPPSESGKLLPKGEDSLSVALKHTFPNWSVQNIISAAFDSALSSDDFSLVALAALSKDPVVVTALRESFVLYALPAAGCAAIEPEYVWRVDEPVRARAEKFIATFNRLFNDSLPQAVPANARAFWDACDEGKIVGRCVRIGFDDSSQPVKHYHWAIDGDLYNLKVTEFWDTEFWTTSRYREKLHREFDDGSDEDYQYEPDAPRPPVAADEQRLSLWRRILRPLFGGGSQLH